MNDQDIAVTSVDLAVSAELGVGGGTGSTIGIQPGGGGPSTEPVADTVQSDNFGSNGSVTVTPEVDGDLGSLYMNLNTYLLLQQSRRQNSTLNGIYMPNHRYRGHREANKFNLVIQSMLTQCVSMFLTLRTSNLALTTSEITDMYPTETEIQKVYHVQQQLRFKEWLLMKDEDKRWFV